MITDKTIARLRKRCAKFWEAAAAATLTRQQEVDYWESCADALPGLLDEIERLRTGCSEQETQDMNMRRELMRLIEAGHLPTASQDERMAGAIAENANPATLNSKTRNTARRILPRLRRRRHQ